MSFSIAPLAVQASNVTQVADKLIQEHPDMISKWKESNSSLTDQEIESFVNAVSAKVEASSDLTEENIGSKLNKAFEQVLEEGEHDEAIITAALSFGVDPTTREIPAGLEPMKEVIKEALVGESSTKDKQPSTPTNPVPPSAGTVIDKIFSDIQGHWAEKDILTLYEKGILKGNNGKAIPNSNVTRAEFVTFLVNLLELHEEAEIHFKDAPSTAWYHANLAKGYKAGLIKGFDKDTVRPNDPITREQMAVIIHEAVKLKGMTITSGNKLVFKDQAKISSWAKEAIDATSSMGFIHGLNDQTFNPQGKATRAEAAALIARLAEKIVD